MPDPLARPLLEQVDGKKSRRENFMRSRFKLAFGFGLAMTTALSGAALAQEKTLRIGMTAADIPRTLGQPDQGFEGNRFTGIPIYDALTHWDLSKEKEPSALIPGLATEWTADERQDEMGVQAAARREIPRRLDLSTPTRSSGTCRRCSTRRAPHFDASQVGVTASRMPTLRSARADRRHDGRADDLRARQLPADQPDEPVHRLADALGGEARGGAGLRHRPAERGRSRPGRPSRPTRPAPARSA